MFNTIIAASDGSEHSRRAIDIAAGLAASHGSRLVLIHVVGQGEVPEGLRRMAEVEHLVEEEHLNADQVADLSRGIAVAERPESSGYLARLHEAIGDRLLSDARNRCARAGVLSISTVREIGDPAYAIVHCAETEDADLIVMGTRGMSGIASLLMGSVSHKVCQLAGCPCLTAK
jgi:nucleotide-binding universal stress UspA family protein